MRDDDDAATAAAATNIAWATCTKANEYLLCLKRQLLFLFIHFSRFPLPRIHFDPISTRCSSIGILKTVNLLFWPLWARPWNVLRNGRQNPENTHNCFEREKHNYSTHCTDTNEWSAINYLSCFDGPTIFFLRLKAFIKFANIENEERQHQLKFPHLCIHSRDFFFLSLALYSHPRYFLCFKFCVTTQRKKKQTVGYIDTICLSEGG